MRLGSSERRIALVVDFVLQLLAKMLQEDREARDSRLPAGGVIGAKGADTLLFGARCVLSGIY